MQEQSLTMLLNLNDQISQPLKRIIKQVNLLKKKAIRTTIKVEDKASKTLNSIVTKSKSLKSTVKAQSEELQAFGKEKEDSLKKIVEVSENYRNKIKESVAAAQVQKANESMLASTLKLRTNATKQQINSILKLTSAQQKNGVVSDNVQMAGANQLASYVENTNSIKSLIPEMNNLLASQKGVNSTSEDAVGVADLMGQALNGNTDALAEAGLKFSDAQKNVLEYGKEEERVAALADIISGNVGNANQELAKTDIGEIQKAKNVFMDLQEQIGIALLPCLSDFANWFSEFATKHKKVVVFVALFLGILAGIVGVISAIVTVVTTISTAIELLTVVQGLFNLTLAACPLIWIVVGIMAVIAAIVALIVYWDEVKAAAANLWQSITDYFGNLKDSVVGFFTDMVEGIKQGWTDIIEFIKHPIKGMIELSEKTSADKIENKGGLNGNKPTSKQKGQNNAGDVQTADQDGGNGAISHEALGTSYWKGGLTYINERGGEIVDLPNGSRVIPADKSNRMLNSGSVNFGNIYVTAKGVTAKEVVDEIVPQLKLKLANI